MLATIRQIVETLRKAEEHLLAAMATEDRNQRLRLEDKAERYIEFARQLEKELETLE